MRFSQSDLVIAILNCLAKQVPGAMISQANFGVICEAATRITIAMNGPNLIESIKYDEATKKSDHPAE